MHFFDPPIILYKKNSKFNQIIVTEEGSIRTLWTSRNDKPNDKETKLKNFEGKTRQTVIDIQNLLFPQLEYTKNILLGLALYPSPESILVIGLGGGYIPTRLNKFISTAKIHVIEIDKNILKVAKKYFQFITTPRLKVIIDDAHSFINNTKEKYDIIIMDAYLGGDIPEKLRTMDFFYNVKCRLTEEGALIANLFTNEHMYYSNMMEKISSFFKYFWFLPCKESGNTIVYASNISHSRTKVAQKMKNLRNYFENNE